MIVIAGGMIPKVEESLKAMDEGVAQVVIVGKLKAGDLLFAHCPERVLPGRTMEELISNDRIIGGLTPEAAQRAREQCVLCSEPAIAPREGERLDHAGRAVAPRVPARLVAL